MASDSSPPSSLEQLINSRNRDLSLFLPLLLSLSNQSAEGSVSSPSTPDRESEHVRERILLINPATQGMIVIESSRSLEDLFREMGEKVGLPPASKASIDAMPKVVVTEEDAECSICLEGWEIGGEAREMPCKHRYHSGCIEKWLGVHGSCPVCRFKMPVDEDEGKKTSGDGEDEERGGGRREIWVRFAFGGRRGSDSADTTDSTESDSSPRPEDGASAATTAVDATDSFENREES